MTVRELVGGEVIGTQTSSSLREAVQVMADNGVGALAVMGDGLLVGILSERDMIRACSEDADLAVATAGQWMTRGPDYLDPDMTVDAAADWMLAAGYRHLPVVDGGNLVGMVSIKDILWALTERSSV